MYVGNPEISIFGHNLVAMGGLGKMYYLFLKNLRIGLARMIQACEGAMVLYQFSQLD
tara:strand:- start:126 stop:296 length:171 start_codon:yes stop_codon:yes gene_type:complete